MNPNNITANDPAYVRSWRDVNQFRDVMSTETSKGFDLTLMTRPVKGLQARFTIGKADVITRPDFSSFRAYYDAAVKRGDEDPALIADAKEVLDSSDYSTKPSGARAAPWSASWVLDYSFPRDTWEPLKGVRVGVNGSWRDSYLFGISNGRELVGGTTHGIGAYVMREQRVWGHVVRVRLGVKNLIDLENTGDARKTGFTTLANGAAVFRYTYVMPAQYDVSLTVRF
jgi:hypothetical protein